MKKIVGWPLCQIFYYIGHWAYLFIDRVLPDSWSDEPGPVFRAGWVVYQRAMQASSDINDWAGLRCWSPVKTEQSK